MGKRQGKSREGATYTYNLRAVIFYSGNLIGQATNEVPINKNNHTVNSELLSQRSNEVVIWGYHITQGDLNTGPWKFGDKADCVAIKELAMLHTMNTLRSKYVHEPSKGQDEKALSSLC